MTQTEKTQYLKEALPFYANLSDAQQQTLQQNATPVTYKKGIMVHNGLNECNGVLVITSGIMRAYLLSDQGKEVTLFKLKQGDVCVLTAGCIIKNISFEIFISAETEVQAILIDRKTYDTFKQTILSVEQFTNELLNQRFSDTMWAIEKILFMSFDKRLAMFLLEEMETQNSNTLNITHNEIANNIGSAREVVTRMLNYFATDQIVELSKGKITILEPKKLRGIL